MSSCVQTCAGKILCVNGYVPLREPTPLPYMWYRKRRQNAVGVVTPLSADAGSAMLQAKPNSCVKKQRRQVTTPSDNNAVRSQRRQVTTPSCYHASKSLSSDESLLPFASGATTVKRYSCRRTRDILDGYARAYSRGLLAPAAPPVARLYVGVLPTLGGAAGASAAKYTCIRRYSQVWQNPMRHGLEKQ